MTFEEHEAAVQAAERDLADIQAQIAAAKQEHERTAPAAALRDGLSLVDAGARHAAAEAQVGFLLDAADAAAANVRLAQELSAAASVERRYRPKFQAAVAKRLAANKAYEDARLALEAAETDYETATRAIEEAISHGLDRPAHLREHPLRLSWTIDHRTRVQLRPYAAEAALWGAYL